MEKCYPLFDFTAIEFFEKMLAMYCIILYDISNI